MSAVDAVVVGAGPNGLAAALTLAKAGLRVEVFEGSSVAGGGCRTEERTIAGFRHDVCATIVAFADSPFFAGLDLGSLGVTLLAPEVAVAHPLDGGRAAAVVGSVSETAAGLGSDRRAYERLLGPLVAHHEAIVATALAPIRSAPKRPLVSAGFGALGVRSVASLASRFERDETRALVAGVGAHAVMPLTAPLTGAVTLLLAMSAHASGWPVVQGGSGMLSAALVDELIALGATVTTDRWVTKLRELTPSAATLLDVSPSALCDLAHDQLPVRFARQLRRFEHGPGVCKVDFALSGPVPWEAEVCRRAGTVHVGGTFEEVAAAEADAAAGRHAPSPFCIVVQPSVVDPSRAPAGQHALWAYCHVPHGSDVDMTAAITAQIERFAPGFSELVLAHVTETACDLARRNPNLIGGDISGGAATVRQTLFRPTTRWDPYSTPVTGLYLCSSSTPPGGGVHGMCGMGAANAALRDLGVRVPR